MSRIVVWIVVAQAFILMGCQKDYISRTEIRENLEESELFLLGIENLTDIQVYDIFSPPVASRVYTYPSIAAYEAMSAGHSDYDSFVGRLSDFTPWTTNADTALVSYDLAAIYAFNAVGKKLVFSEERMEDWQTQVDSIVGSWQVNPKTVEESKAYAQQIVDHIWAWAKQDNYDQTRTMPKFSVTDDPSRWKPTPPAYMEGIEPHWNKMRTLVIDSAAQFRPAAPPAYDLSEGSTFHGLVKEVYDVGNSLDEEQRLIASFWDCNPFVMNQTGHIMHATKKITPGGHWMGIAGVASRTAKSNFMETVQAHTMVSITLFDAFISCWDEKYRSSLIRPETVINEIMDPDWLPTLQTPPFPEHTSGHSVISTASAVVLTQLYGDDFSFVDVVEVKYNLPERSFNSFMEASQEAAISRLYGGIHYRPAIEDGVTQGQQVGDFIVNKLLDNKEGISSRM
ncbi:MAG: vanadium-dependent haloperoxidase [Bacteroidota bacterium]